MKKEKREPYQLPDEECERLRRSEMAAVRMLLAYENTVVYAKDDLKARLSCLPYGCERMNMIVGGIRSLMGDLLGTVSIAQQKQIYNTTKDCEIHLVPKLTPMSQNVVMSAHDVAEMIDCARTKCVGCTETDTNCRNCRLYRLLEMMAPQEDYGGGFLCPYAKDPEKWIDEEP